MAAKNQAAQQAQIARMTPVQRQQYANMAQEAAKQGQRAINVGVTAEQVAAMSPQQRQQFAQRMQAGYTGGATQQAAPARATPTRPILTTRR
jgi:hypothetical protein